MEARPIRNPTHRRCLLACVAVAMWLLAVATTSADPLSKDTAVEPASYEPAPFRGIAVGASSDKAVSEDASEPADDDLNGLDLDWGELLDEPFADLTLAQPFAAPEPIGHRPEQGRHAGTDEAPVQSVEADSLRDRAAEAIGVPIARRLEHAATAADTGHKLTRLVARCREALRIGATDDEAPSPSDHRRIKRVAAWALTTLGRRHEAAGAPRDALADYEAALDFMPDDAASLAASGRLLATLGEPHRAIPRLNAAVESLPADAGTRLNRAIVSAMLGNHDGVLADTAVLIAASQQAASTKADSATVRRLRGSAFLGLGRPTLAAAEFEHAVRATPHDPGVRLARGHAFAAAGMYRQAAADYEATLRLDPRDADAYRALAWLLATCPDRGVRDGQTAVVAASRAERLSPRPDQRVLEASAAAYAAVGDFASAIRQQQRVVALCHAERRPAARERLARYRAGEPHVLSR